MIQMFNAIILKILKIIKMNKNKEINYRVKETKDNHNFNKIKKSNHNFNNIEKHEKINPHHNVITICLTMINIHITEAQDEKNIIDFKMIIMIYIIIDKIKEVRNDNKKQMQ